MSEPAEDDYLPEWEVTPDTTFARAWQDAEQRKADEEARRLAVAEALAAQMVELHIYDPLPYPEAAPHDPSLYGGTGIGVLYGLPGTECFLPELGDWRIVPRSSRLAKGA